MLDLSRRSMLASSLGFVACAPAIVRVSSLMPVKALPAKAFTDEWAAQFSFGTVIYQRTPIWDRLDGEWVRVWVQAT